MPMTSPDSTRERILTAAAALYAEHGFEVPLSNVAREARVTTAVLQQHFRTRKALVDAVIKAKPAGAKGTYLKQVALSSTMGPGVRVELASVSGA